jgi:hypothetical protein
MSVIALHLLGPHSWTQVLRRPFFLVLFVDSFTRFLRNGLSLFSNFPFIILLFLLLSLLMHSFSVTIFLFYFFLYFTTLPLLSFAFILPVCTQLPNIFQFLLYFCYISISFVVVFILLLNIQSSLNSVSSVVFLTFDNSPLFNVRHVCFIILTLKLNLHFYFSVHLCLCLFVLLFFLNFSLSQLNVPVCYTHTFLTLVGINGLVSVRCLTFCMKNFDLRKK